MNHDFVTEVGKDVRVQRRDNGIPSLRTVHDIGRRSQDKKKLQDRLRIEKAKAANLRDLPLRPYIYGHFTSRDRYSGNEHAARMRGSMSNPRRVRYIVFALFLLSR